MTLLACVYTESWDFDCGVGTDSSCNRESDVLTLFGPEKLRATRPEAHRILTGGLLGLLETILPSHNRNTSSQAI